MKYLLASVEAQRRKGEYMPDPLNFSVPKAVRISATPLPCLALPSAPAYLRLDLDAVTTLASLDQEF
jgi:hypothetical protein